eukprot:TRINITY_DN67792_c1_g3_i1.p1 TRINITY_DN67792_c1_g3~~TRINITY_DN67792_c1_g3_i1.p1  ORF type:complete len:793 (-),score=43.83 TRINITY_DN67792_c1_g3_i1:1744-3774(-)
MAQFPVQGLTKGDKPMSFVLPFFFVSPHVATEWQTTLVTPAVVDTPKLVVHIVDKVFAEMDKIPPGWYVCPSRDDSSDWTMVTSCDKCPHFPTVVAGSPVCGETQFIKCNNNGCDKPRPDGRRGVGNVEITIAGCPSESYTYCRTEWLSCPRFGNCHLRLSNERATKHIGRQAYVACPTQGDCKIEVINVNTDYWSLGSGTYIKCPAYGNCILDCGYQKGSSDDGPLCRDAFVMECPKDGNCDITRGNIAKGAIVLASVKGDTILSDTRSTDLLVVGGRNGDLTIDATQEIDQFYSSNLIIGPTHGKMDITCGAEACNYRFMAIDMSGGASVECYDGGCTFQHYFLCLSGDCKMDCTTGGTQYQSGYETCYSAAMLCQNGDQCKSIGDVEPASMVCPETQSNCVAGSSATALFNTDCQTCTKESYGEAGYVLCPREGDCTLSCLKDCFGDTIICPINGDCIINTPDGIEDMKILGPQQSGALRINCPDKNSCEDGIFWGYGADSMHITCSGKNTCENDFIVRGPDNGPLNLVCSGEFACEDDQAISCGPIGDCNIQCTGLMSCRSDFAVLGAEEKGDLVVNCAGDYSCSRSAMVVCPANGNCEVLCSGFSACNGMHVVCPRKGDCKVRCSFDACEEKLVISCPRENPSCDGARGWMAKPNPDAEVESRTFSESWYY